MLRPAVRISARRVIVQYPVAHLSTLRCHRDFPALFSFLDDRHSLPHASNLDDGAESFEMSCAMAEMAIEDGITHVIATPHASPDHAFIPEFDQAAPGRTSVAFPGTPDTCARAAISTSVLRILQEIRHDATRFTLNQKNYLLVEFADFSIPPSLDQACMNCSSRAFVRSSRIRNAIR